MPWKEVGPDITGETDLGGRPVTVRVVRYDPESKAVDVRLRLAADNGSESSRLVLNDGEFKPHSPKKWEEALLEGSH